jgi:hypothetical protein
MNEIILEFLFGTKEYVQAIPLAAAAPLISGAAQLIGGLFSGGKAKRAAKKAERQRRSMEQKLSRLEASRQDIIDPYAGVTDLSSMITNPFAGMPIATQGAEMAMEAAGQSRAEQLDYLRSIGAGASGAMQVALQEQRQIQQASAGIEQQERQNLMLQAQGEQAAQTARMQEKQRVQALEARGKEFVFEQRETRELAQLDRTQAMMEDARAQAAAYRDQSRQAFGSALGAAGGLALGGLTGAFKGLGGAKASNPTGALNFFGSTSKYLNQ